MTSERLEESYYSPREAARILSRSGLKIGERRVRQMAADGELEAYQSEGGHWRVPQREVHRLLERRRERAELREEPQTPLESPQSAAELLERLLDAERRAARSEERVELEERTRSTIEDQLQRERERADRAEAEARELRDRMDAVPRSERSLWRRIFGSR